jgi:hypothetical protein
MVSIFCEFVGKKEHKTAKKNQFKGMESLGALRELSFLHLIYSVFRKKKKNSKLSNKSCCKKKEE